MALTGGPEGLVSAGKECCKGWGKIGTRWRSVDAWGRVVGEVEVVESQYFENTGCHELKLKTRQGIEGSGIFASVDGGWRPPASARWTPTAAERRSLWSFIDQAERLLVTFKKQDPREPYFPDGLRMPPREKRALFFRVPRRELDVDPQPFTPTRYAVVGGAVLLVIYLDPSGRWMLQHVENEGTYDRRHILYIPVAVFDMDNDTYPEIILHYSERDWWGDDVLKLDPEFDSWSVKARSVGGSTT